MVVEVVEVATEEEEDLESVSLDHNGSNFCSLIVNKKRISKDMGHLSLKLISKTNSTTKLNNSQFL